MKNIFTQRNKNKENLKSCLSTGRQVRCNRRGFTLLFSVLVATLVVSIGATIISIALRQTILSGTSRESQYAFYAANTALECAYYWDKTGSLGTNDSNIIFPENGGSQTDNFQDVDCSGYNLKADDEGDLETTGGESTFNLVIENKVDTLSPFDFNYEYCANVKVIKTLTTSSNVKTRIEVKGYNTCDETNARRVERGLVQEYES